MADIAAQPARPVQRTTGMRPRHWLALDGAMDDMRELLGILRSTRPSSAHATGPNW